VVDQAAAMNRPPVVKRLFQRIEDEARMGGPAVVAGVVPARTAGTARAACRAALCSKRTKQRGHP
jgi:hypothetical protein